MKSTGYYRDKAKELFLSGYNCSQAVLCAFSHELDIPPESAMLIASPFGAGMSGMREVCGAVTGMAMAAGLMLGHSKPMSQKEKAQLYACVRELSGRFREKNRSVICRELLNMSHVTYSDVPQARTAEYYKKRPCPELCADAAEILAQYLLEVKN